MVQSERHSERAKILLEEMWMEFFTRGAWQAKYAIFRVYFYRRMIKFCYHLPPVKSWLTSTDLGSRRFFAKSVRSKSFLRKPYLKNMSPEPFCYDDFSTDFIEFPLCRGCYTKSVNSESRLKYSHKKQTVWKLGPNGPLCWEPSYTRTHSSLPGIKM